MRPPRIGLRVPAGMIAIYGDCEEVASNRANTPMQPQDSTCIRLNEFPSPIVSAPQEIDPAEIARVALQFAGLSANEAANFTQTVDWTSTFVLPILRGQSTYEKVNVGGNGAVLIRPRDGRGQPSAQFNLIWVDNGMMYSLMGAGDDTTALNLASQIE